MARDKFIAQLTKELKANGLKVNKEKVSGFIAAVAKSMAEGLINDRALIVSNFGSFSVSKYGAKMIQSPRGDNKKFFMPPTDVVKWLPSRKIRTTGGSKAISDEEYKKLKENPELFREDLMAMDQVEAIEKEPAKNPYEIIIEVKAINDCISDESSPISKFVKNIIREMKKLSAEKLEIKPNRYSSEIIFTANGSRQSTRILPKESQKILLDKFKSLADNESNLLLISTGVEARLQTKLTPFGEMLIVEKIIRSV